MICKGSIRKTAAAGRIIDCRTVRKMSPLNLVVAAFLMCFFGVSFVIGQSCPPHRCPLLKSGVSQTDIKTILGRHNSVRQKIANGQQSGFLTASNMIQLSWDNELAKIAQSHSDGCTFEHSKNNCKKNNRGWDWVGENLYMTKSSQVSQPPEWANAVDSWYNEFQDYPPSKIANFGNVPGKMTGHFTQVIWAKTSRIGCGYAAYKNQGSDARTFPIVQLYTCNYGPGGNILTEEVTKKGSPCSGCPGGKCSSQYKGLCPTK